MYKRKRFRKPRKNLGNTRILHYTDIIRYNRRLVILRKDGNNYVASWLDDMLLKLSDEFLIPATDKGFIFNDVEYTIKLNT